MSDDQRPTKQDLLSVLLTIQSKALSSYVSTLSQSEVSERFIDFDQRLAASIARKHGVRL